MPPPDLTVTHEPATGGQPEAQQPLLADEAGQQLVVGDIPVAVPVSSPVTACSARWTTPMCGCLPSVPSRGWAAWVPPS